MLDTLKIIFSVISILCVIFLILSKHDKSEIKGNKEILRLIKVALPYIFTKNKYILLFAFFGGLQWLDYKNFAVENYFSISLTALALLLTTTNVSRNIFSEEDLKRIGKKKWEAYLGKFLYTAFVWILINLISLLCPFIKLKDIYVDNVHLNPILSELGSLLFILLLLFGILLIFDLLLSTIRLYQKDITFYINALKEKYANEQIEIEKLEESREKLINNGLEKKLLENICDIVTAEIIVNLINERTQKIEKIDSEISLHKTKANDISKQMDQLKKQYEDEK